MKIKKRTFIISGIIFIVLTVSIVIIFMFSQRSKQWLIENYHGPNPNNDMTIADTQIAFAQSMETITLMPTLTPTATKSPVVTATGYGIAAGGGLMSMGQGDLDAYFQSMKTLGVQWVRWDIDWSVIQRDSQTSFHWEGADRVNATAKRFGIKSLGIITYTPRWAMGGLCRTDSACSPSNPKVFGVFAGQVALRYKDSIFSWEIWNEPNLRYATRWSSDLSVKKYSDLLHESYTEIKKANPQATVVSGGLSASGNEPDGSISPLTFLTGLYTSGGKNYFDAVAVHPYTYPASPNYVATWNHWQEMNSIHNLMVNKGDGTKKIWITEYGAPTNGPGRAFGTNEVHTKFAYGADFMSEGSQVDQMKEALSFHSKNTSWLGPMFWYSLQDRSSNKDTPENFFGLLRADKSQKPAYAVFKSAM